MYGFLADVVVAIHVGYVLFVVFGQLAIFLGWLFGWRWTRQPVFRYLHLLMMGIVVYEELMDIRCPLTVWEEQLRRLANQPVSDATFMGRLLHSLIFYDAPSWVFTAGYLTFGFLVFASAIFYPPNRLSKRRLQST